MPGQQNKDQHKSQDKSDNQAMNVDVGHLSVTGHVVFAGRDGQVNVNTGGDVEQTNTMSMTIGGVDTTRQAYDSLIASLRSTRQTIETTLNNDPDAKQAAHQEMDHLEEQFTSEKKPNPYILVRAAKSLYRFSPAIAGAIVSLFSEPLAAQIVTGIGGLAVNFYDALLKTQPKNA